MTGYRFSKLARTIRQTIRRDPAGWALMCGVQLRPYQEKIALAIKDSVIHGKGLTFVVILPRQSGKNEVQRHVFGWLLYRAAERGGTIVSVAPTFKPQTINAMERVRLSLDGNIATRGQWHSSAGFIFRFHKARLQFFSGENKSRVVGATADLLLSVDEAQDIDPAKFDKEFDPMTASTNATRVFWGTAWTSQTLLARQAKMAREEEAKDGIQRLFYYTGEDVAKIVPEYAAHLERVVKERGRNHPLVKTQYFNEELDAAGGMFNAGRMALMFSGQLSASPVAHAAGVADTRVTLARPISGQPENSPQMNADEPLGRMKEGLIAKDGEPPSAQSTTKEETKSGPFAFCIDVGGMDESSLSGQAMEMVNPGRDSTTLSVVQVDLSTLKTLQGPTYRVIHREAWTGQNHVTVFGKLKALSEKWRPQHIVVDATGVGEGLWAMLDKAFPTRVIPVKFSQQEKSEIGWRFLSIIETGRFREAVDANPRPSSDGGGQWRPDAAVTQQSALSERARLQYSMCQSELLPGPAKTLRWGVPDGRRGPDGQLVHDDFILADALVAKLDELKWHIHFEPFIIQAKDPLEEMGEFRVRKEQDVWMRYGE
jgi:hypothetical protein